MKHHKICSVPGYFFPPEIKMLVTLKKQVKCGNTVTLKYVLWFNVISFRGVFSPKNLPDEIPYKIILMPIETWVHQLQK